MRELWIENINSADAKSLADEWESYLSNVGCEIYIQAVHHRMTIAWEISAPSTIHHIIDFADNTFGDSDIWDISELERSIRYLKDGCTVIFDSDCGDVRVIKS